MARRFDGSLILPTALLLACGAAAQPPDPEAQIRGAVAPAPPELRESATVLGYSADGELVTLREGDGELICLADDPGDERYHAACYHRSLEPFMRRGRELRAGGLEREEVQRIREEEIEAGTLPMPEEPRALYSLTGSLEAFDPAGGALREGNRVSVVYIPYATEESTGLSPEPVMPGAPWIMHPGKPWAHIMVVQEVRPAAESSDGSARAEGEEPGADSGS